MQPTLARMALDVSWLHNIGSSPGKASRSRWLQRPKGADLGIIRWSPSDLQVCKLRQLAVGAVVRNPGNWLVHPPGHTWSYLEDRRGQAEFDVSNSEWPHCDAEPAYSKIQRNGSLGLIHWKLVVYGVLCCRFPTVLCAEYINDNYDCIDESMLETRTYEAAAVFVISRFSKISKHKTICRTKIMLMCPWHIPCVQDYTRSWETQPSYAMTELEDALDSPRMFASFILL